MLVAENVVVDGSTQYSVRVSGQAGAMLKNCRLDAGEGGMIVTDMSNSTLQHCIITGTSATTTHMLVSCGGQVKAQDLKVTGVAGAGIAVDGADSNAELHACHLTMSEGAASGKGETGSPSDNTPIKVTSKGSVNMINCCVKGGAGGIQARTSMLSLRQRAACLALWIFSEQISRQNTL
jgi:hypothetical protein